MVVPRTYKLISDTHTVKANLANLLIHGVVRKFLHAMIRYAYIYGKTHHAIRLKHSCPSMPSTFKEIAVTMPQSHYAR